MHMYLLYYYIIIKFLKKTLITAVQQTLYKKVICNKFNSISFGKGTYNLQNN